MKIAVFGLGYVGMVTAACLADQGHYILGVEVDAEKLEKLRRGRSPVMENGLDDLVRNGFRSGRIHVSADGAGAIRESDMGCRSIGILGLSLKPGSDDLRESPLVILAKYLLDNKLDVRIFDEDVRLNELLGVNRSFMADRFPEISHRIVPSIEELVSGSELIVVGKLSTASLEYLQHNLSIDQCVVDLIGISSSLLDELPYTHINPNYDLESLPGFFSFKGSACLAGNRYVRIDYAGNIYRCSMARSVIGNVFKKKFARFDGAEPCPYRICPCSYYGLEYAKAKPKTVKIGPVLKRLIKLKRDLTTQIHRLQYY